MHIKRTTDELVILGRALEHAVEDRDEVAWLRAIAALNAAELAAEPDSVQRARARVEVAA